MKRDAEQTPALGDWISSYSSGIWRVYRVIHDAQKLRFSLQERQRVDRRRLVFSKRLVDEMWKPTFSNELSSSELVSALTDDNKRRLEEFIVKNPQTLREFEAFQPKPIDQAMDLPLNVPTSIGKEDIQHLIRDVFAGIGEGLTNDAILQRLAASELARYAPKTIRNATLRFVCKDHELHDNEYVFREVQLLMA
jgi:hypothetical protein